MELWGGAFAKKRQTGKQSLSNSPSHLENVLPGLFLKMFVCKKKSHADHLFGVSVLGWSSLVVNGNLILAYHNAINLCASGALELSPETMLQTTTKSENIPIVCP